MNKQTNIVPLPNVSDADACRNLGSTCWFTSKSSYQKCAFDDRRMYPPMATLWDQTSSCVQVCKHAIISGWHGEGDADVDGGGLDQGRVYKSPHGSTSCTRAFDHFLPTTRVPPTTPKTVRLRLSFSSYQTVSLLYNLFYYMKQSVYSDLFRYTKQYVYSILFHNAKQSVYSNLFHYTKQ